MNQQVNNTDVALYHKKLLNDQLAKLEALKESVEFDVADTKYKLSQARKKLLEIEQEAMVIKKVLISINTDPDLE